MRILVLHNTYQRAGGEDVAVATEVDMLRRAGHSVELAMADNHEIAGFGGKVRTLLRTPHDPARAAWTEQAIDRSGAELVHIHNFFPLLTPAVHEAAARRGVAVVQTLHNYRLICAGAMLLRDGKICETCVTGNRLAGVVHRCYRGSLPGSAAVVAMQARAEREGTWHRHVHRFIALTTFARSKFVAGGLPAERIAVKPNNVTAPAMVDRPGRRGALFVGRLSPEKGVDVLLRAWRKIGSMDLSIVGDGPERAALQAAAPANVRFLGQLPAEAVREQMMAAQLFVMPSICYEGFGLTLIEAFAAGLPVIASRLGSLAEIVGDGVEGRLFAPGDSDALAAAVTELAGAPDGGASYGRAGRAAYERLYTPERGIGQLEAIYAAALAEAGARR